MTPVRSTPLCSARGPWHGWFVFCRGLVLLLVAGCVQFYQEPPGGKEEVSVLIAPSLYSKDYRFFGVGACKSGLSVLYIDRVVVKRGPTDIRIRPGRRNLAFEWFECGPETWITSGIEFEAEPARTYELHFFPNEKRVWTWVTDQKTGVVVAGTKPPKALPASPAKPGG